MKSWRACVNTWKRKNKPVEPDDEDYGKPLDEMLNPQQLAKYWADKAEQDRKNAEHKQLVEANKKRFNPTGIDYGEDDNG